MLMKNDETTANSFLRQEFIEQIKNTITEHGGCKFLRPPLLEMMERMALKYGGYNHPLRQELLGQVEERQVLLKEIRILINRVITQKKKQQKLLRSKSGEVPQ
ncbi:MAG: hypothetical protein PHQ35_11175 [Phycisphaerae bacterium]|nr:hypothetical protein [Phycisphaerae bacterium]